MKKANFIGILDIAGMKCFNFFLCPCKLIFSFQVSRSSNSIRLNKSASTSVMKSSNNFSTIICKSPHMIYQYIFPCRFVLEQEEYVREGIEWEMVDFGMDLEATIQCMEKPMGLMAILEEETLFPKASDKSFEDKLKENLLGKTTAFLKKQPGSKDKNAHFALAHYAGIVNYNITDWLTKNKDQINDTVVDLLKKCDNQLVVYLFR